MSPTPTVYVSWPTNFSDQDCRVWGALRTIGRRAGPPAGDEPSEGVEDAADGFEDLSQAHRVPGESQGRLQDLWVGRRAAKRLGTGTSRVCERARGKEKSPPGPAFSCCFVLEDTYLFLALRRSPTASSCPPPPAPHARFLLPHPTSSPRAAPCERPLKGLRRLDCLIDGLASLFSTALEHSMCL